LDGNADDAADAVDNIYFVDGRTLIS